MEFKDLLEKVIREKESLPDLLVCEMKEIACTKPGDNFMSVVNAMEVVGKLSGGTLYKTSVIVKRTVGNADRRKFYHVDDAFKNEGLMYTKVLPLLDVTEPCAHCYHAADDVIVLQDLRLDGYHMGDRNTGFNQQNATKILKALAKFHAASYYPILSKKEDFLECVRELKSIGVILTSNKDMMETCLQRVITQVREVPDIEDIIPILNRLKGKVSQSMKELSKAKNIAVLCHGDFWINNILVRSTPEDSVRIIDLQACSVLSPAVDVWTFLYTSLQPPLMDNCFDQLVEVYCESFVKELRNLNVATKHIPSVTDLIKEVESKEMYGFLIGTVYVPALALSSDHIPELDNIREQMQDEEFVQQFLTSDFQGRICSFVRVCKRRGIFNESFGE